MTDLSGPEPIFILTAPGLPGQTLAAALGQGGMAYDLPELSVFLAESVSGLMRDLVGLRGVQMHGILRALAQLLAGEQSLGSVDMARRWMIRRGYQTSELAMAEILALLAPRPLAMPVTSPLFEAPAIVRMTKAFPKARYVHLQAHPHLYGRHISVGVVGQAAMQLTGSMDPSQQPAAPEPVRLWLQWDDAVKQVAEKVGAEQIIGFKTEDLLDDPGPALAALCDKLELPSDAVAVERMLRPEASPFAGPGPMGAFVASAIQSLAALKREMPDPSLSELDGPAPWRLDGAIFDEDVIQRATAIGYAPPFADLAEAETEAAAG